MPQFIIGFYTLPGVEGIVTVESRLVGHAQTDYANLAAALKKLYPNLRPGEAKRTGSTIEVREDVAPSINPNPGMHLRQIFEGAPKGDTTGLEVFRNIGTVFFDGTSNDIHLRYHAEKGTVGLSLTDRMSRNVTRFSNQMNASLSVDELPTLIASILGNNHKELKIRLQRHPEPKQPGSK
jgi:hypothetical protein